MSTHNTIMETNKMTTDTLTERLQRECYPAPDNPWFTQRVLNRLPARERSRRWIVPLLVAAALLACAACWGFVFSNMCITVITVREVIQVAIMLIATAVVLWQSVVTIVHAD